MKGTSAIGPRYAIVIARRRAAIEPSSASGRQGKRAKRRVGTICDPAKIIDDSHLSIEAVLIRIKPPDLMEGKAAQRQTLSSL